jgi:hypothetical protein
MGKQFAAIKAGETRIESIPKLSLEQTGTVSKNHEGFHRCK